MLGERGQVEVVLEHDRHAERLLEQPPQRRGGEPGGTRDQAGEAVARRDAGNADAGRPDLFPGFARQLAAERRDARRQLLAGGGHRLVRPRQQRAARVAERDAQVGRAEVHAEQVRHVSYPRSEMAVTADTLAADHRALTEACGLVDRSDRGKLALTGPEAKAFLHGQVTNDIEGLEPGRGCYAAFLTHKGKMLGDLRVLDLGDELLIDTERSTLQELFNMIRRYKLGSDVELHKRTLELGLLSLAGPDARRVAGADGLGPAEHDNVRAEIAGTPVVLVATDVGVDVFAPADATEAVRAALEAAGAAGVTEEAAETLRVERGRPRYGVDLDDGTIPQEAGLNERAVSFTKGCYVGQETVARLYYRGKPNRHLRGLRLSAPAAGGDDAAARREGGRARRQRRALPRPRADRARDRAPRGRTRRHARRGRGWQDRRGGRSAVPRVASLLWPRTCSSSPASPPARRICWTR